MFHRLLVVSRIGEDSSLLVRKLTRNRLYHVELVSNATDAIDAITSEITSLVVFNMDLFTKQKALFASNLRSIGYMFPVLFLARTIANDSYNVVSELRKTVLLERPTEDKDLYGVTDKLINGADVGQRIHRRFYTNQNASAENFRCKDHLEMRMKNLSRGGAFLEYGQGEIKIGDTIKLAVELREVSRQYVVNAKVVWTTDDSPWGGGQGVGVEFLRSGDVYRNLLQRL